MARLVIVIFYKKVCHAHFVWWISKTFAVRPGETRLPELFSCISTEHFDGVNLHAIVLFLDDWKNVQPVEQSQCVGCEVHSPADDTWLRSDFKDFDIRWSGGRREFSKSHGGREAWSSCQNINTIGASRITTDQPRLRLESGYPGGCHSRDSFCSVVETLGCGSLITIYRDGMHNGRYSRGRNTQTVSMCSLRRLSRAILIKLDEVACDGLVAQRGRQTTFGLFKL